METTAPQTSPVATGLRYGLFIGIIGVLADFIVRLVRPGVLVFGIVSTVVSLAVSITGLVLAHRYFRRANGGLMSYGQGLLIAVVGLVVSGLLAALFNYVYVNYIDPEFVATMKAELTDFMEQHGALDSQIEQSLKGLDKMQPSLGRAVLGGLGNGAVGGLILGLIISAFTKRKPADFD